MGYVAVKGGVAAIEASIERLRFHRLKGRCLLEVPTVKHTLRGLVDRIMSEGSLYARDLAALAIKQAEGNPEEASFLLRAYRSTLSRRYYSRVIETTDMAVERRISAAFKEIPGGQLLGASYDYTHRLLDFGLIDETKRDISTWLEEFKGRNTGEILSLNQDVSTRMPKVVDYLRAEGLMEVVENDDLEPEDVTRKSLDFPTVRSERLQILTRGETGAVTALGYAAIRAHGAVHPTVGELRVGDIPIFIDYPMEIDGSEDASMYIGDIQVTEVETLFPEHMPMATGKNHIEFEIGYGLCFGQNETKAIAMSILDQCLEKGHRASPVHDEEFVLMHIDCIEATGFISHLKLPHYVTFQSNLDSARKTRKAEEEA